MALVTPKKIDSESEQSKYPKRELYATVCYFYPRYSLQEVEKMPYRDVLLLLTTARKQQAAYFHNLTLIAQAPHSNKQSNVKKLIEYFKKQAGK